MNKKERAALRAEIKRAKKSMADAQSWVEHFQQNVMMEHLAVLHFAQKIEFWEKQLAEDA